MINSVYKKLFNTVIAHDFYVDNISKKDLAVFPTAETEQTMKNNNMLFRTSDDGFRVFYRVDNAGGSFVDFSNIHLVFVLRLQNINEFFNFTNLDDGINPYKAGKILYFTNIGTVTQNELTYDLLDYLKPAMFTYQFPQTTGTTGHIKITGPDNTDVTPSYPDANNVPKTSADTFVYPIDFTGMPKGIYKFETWIDAGAHTIQTVYIDNDLAMQNVFGIVDILAVNGTNGSFPPTPGVPSPPFPPITTPRVYTMRFFRRITQWRYIVVLKSPSVSPAASLGIVDDASQQPYGTLTFSAPTDTTVNGFPAKVFNSTVNTIPYFETPKKNLNIKKDPGATPVMILKNIPGPPIGSVSADPADFGITEIYVYI
jgi:hypothetical protein